MITIDLSQWFSDWLCHWLSSSVAGLLAFWLTLTILLVLFRRAGFRLASFAFSQVLWVGLSTLSTSLSAAIFSALLVHYLQDFLWGAWLDIELIIRIPFLLLQ